MSYKDKREKWVSNTKKFEQIIIYQFYTREYETSNKDIKSNKIINISGKSGAND